MPDDMSYSMMRGMGGMKDGMNEEKMKKVAKMMMPMCMMGARK